MLDRNASTSRPSLVNLTHGWPIAYRNWLVLRLAPRETKFRVANPLQCRELSGNEPIIFALESRAHRNQRRAPFGRLSMRVNWVEAHPLSRQDVERSRDLFGPQPIPVLDPDRVERLAYGRVELFSNTLHYVGRR